jgi:hypothetical protein
LSGLFRFRLSVFEEIPMTLRVSTGLRNALLDTAALKTAMDDFFVDVYTGTQPGSADTAPSGTKLLTYTVGNDGTTGGDWAASASSGALSKLSSQTLQATGLAEGAAGWFRIRLAGDLGTTNTTDKRIDGSIAQSGSDMDMANLSVTVGQIRTLDSLTITLPAAA